VRVARRARGPTSLRILAEGAVPRSNIRAIHGGELSFVDERIEHCLEEPDVLTNERVQALRRLRPSGVGVTAGLAAHGAGHAPQASRLRLETGDRFEGNDAGRTTRHPAATKHGAYHEPGQR
jgi:hypothetical protein